MPTNFRRLMIWGCVAAVVQSLGLGHAEEQEGTNPDAQSKAVFADDFESGHDRWEILDPATWRMAEKDGNHTLEITARESAYAPPVRSPLHVALIKDLELEDFEISFRVRSTKDTGNHRDCCVFFDYQDDQHFYYVHLGAQPDPHSGQIMVVDEAPRLALTKNEKRTPWDDAWHQVRLVRDAESGSIDVFFDDMTTPLMQTTDKRFQSGRIGIGSFDDMNEFDDVVVRAK
ncbi:hypothetical protein [Allorhodopirellula heiligendammensis]|uniref:Laminin G domain protein n=1 Tax=Allorhodopirellula heiligendammensis TaxID=2714739 RepID=A0A5C6C2C0_9BACT|nr:hypothetical protein [Allorhodopirellula heiligendammensis]TWU18235.1 hypothetical protein Poly21_03900 [Allorhodopirellula heiligendammensis]